MKKFFSIPSSISSKILLTVLKATKDLYFIRHHQSLSLSMGVEQARAHLAELERNKSYGFKRLRKRGLIVSSSTKNKIIYKLTNDGKAAALEIILKQMRSKLPLGESLLITFDIPESNRSIRDMFRKILKQFHFKQIHQSCWVTKRDSNEYLKTYLKLTGLCRWAKLFHAKEL